MDIYDITGNTSFIFPPSENANQASSPVPSFPLSFAAEEKRLLSLEDENGSPLSADVTVDAKGSLPLENGSSFRVELDEEKGSVFPISENGSASFEIFDEKMSDPVAVELAKGSFFTADVALVKGSDSPEVLNGSLFAKGSLENGSSDVDASVFNVVSVLSGAVEEAGGAKRLPLENGSLAFD